MLLIPSLPHPSLLPMREGTKQNGKILNIPIRADTHDAGIKSQDCFRDTAQTLGVEPLLPHGLVHSPG